VLFTCRRSLIKNTPSAHRSFRVKSWSQDSLATKASNPSCV
jgi:hypothetical protein